jgi:hypothetical protein
MRMEWSRKWPDKPYVKRLAPPGWRGNNSRLIETYNPTMPKQPALFSDKGERRFLLLPGRALS